MEAGFDEARDRVALTLSLPNMRVCCVSDVHTRNEHASGTDTECFFFLQETLCLMQINCKLK